MGQTASEEEIFQMIAEVDDNGSASIDFGEFLKVIAKQKEMSSSDDYGDILEASVGSVGLCACVACTRVPRTGRGGMVGWRVVP